MAYDRPLAFSSPLCLGRLPAPQATQASELGNPQAKKKPRSDFVGSDRGFPAVGRWSEGGETTTQQKAVQAACQQVGLVAVSQLPFLIL